ncbi:MAG TPA: hypothetical protein VD969_09850 [Symbiobacteriaceae bacterium]|nr:hypothetical protein [Symbiobacteriaceae bacterium]
MANRWIAAVLTATVLFAGREGAAPAVRTEPPERAAADEINPEVAPPPEARARRSPPCRTGSGEGCSS